MPKFRKKPVVIEAMQFTGENKENWRDVLAFAKGYALVAPDRDEENQKTGKLAIDTPEGTMTASQGDWIIRGVKGEFYPCRDDIFRMTYDPEPEGVAMS